MAELAMRLETNAAVLPLFPNAGIVHFFGVRVSVAEIVGDSFEVVHYQHRETERPMIMSSRGVSIFVSGVDENL